MTASPPTTPITFRPRGASSIRSALGKPDATLASIAADSKVSPKYLPMVWQILEEPADKAKQEVGPIAKLQAMWRSLPAPAGSESPGRSRSARNVWRCAISWSRSGTTRPCSSRPR